MSLSLPLSLTPIHTAQRLTVIHFHTILYLRVFSFISPPPPSISPSLPLPTRPTLINNPRAQQVHLPFPPLFTPRRLRYLHYHAIGSFSYVGKVEIARSHLEQLTPYNFPLDRLFLRHCECSSDAVQITTKLEVASQ